MAFRKFSVNEVREDFPILKRTVNGKPLIYFDNAATTQKPQAVIDAIRHYYDFENANVHRGLHFLSELATEAYESARFKAKEFLNAVSASEIVFLRGTTEAINLVASSFGSLLNEGDEVIISEMEHHSNIVPWQLLRDRKGIVLKILPFNDSGELEMDLLDSLITEKTRFISVVHVSNSLGTVNPVKEIIRKAHARGIPVLLDGAQAAGHRKIDVQELDCDFYALSGHKFYAPTGIGVLYGKTKYLEMMPPYQGGGEMIRTVTFEKTTYADLPGKFEAGTPNIEGGIALGAAIDYLNSFNRNDLFGYEESLTRFAMEKFHEIPDLRIIGEASERSSVISFIIKGIHPYDIGTLVDTDGIALRTGHHCNQPVMDHFGLPATARASFAFYNKKEEIEYFIEALKKVIKMLR